MESEGRFACAVDSAYLIASSPRGKMLTQVLLGDPSKQLLDMKRSTRNSFLGYT